MPDDLPLNYWDSCVFLSYINGIADRLRDIDALLERSGKDCQIITSTVTIVEVAFGKVEQDRGELDEETGVKIAGLWASDSPVKVVEFFPALGEAARDLIRKALPSGISLKPMDAIHLATALHMRAVAFHTYDDRLPKFAEVLGIPIGPPLASAPKLL